MGEQIRSFLHLKAGAQGNKRDARFLFFEDELHIGITRDEGHQNILKSSGKSAAEILVAGTIFCFFGETDAMVINCGGSVSLNIAKKDPTPVAKFVENLPGFRGSIVAR